MRLLLDTHVILWWLFNIPTLSTGARDVIEDERNLVAVSAATTWEISIKSALGKLSAPDDLLEQIENLHFVTLPITLADGLSAGQLPRYHTDPFDRMLVAQALNGGFTLVTADNRLAQYGLELLPARLVRQ